MSRIQVRAATEADLPELVSLLAQLDPDDPERESDEMEWYRGTLRQLVELGAQVILLEREDNVLGTLTLYIVPNLSHRATPFALIENVVVDEAHRSEGIGKALMMRAIEIAREAGCYKVTLTSNARRKEAHTFYESLGFGRTHEGFRLNL